MRTRTSITGCEIAADISGPATAHTAACSEHRLNQEQVLFAGALSQSGCHSANPEVLPQTGRCSADTKLVLVLFGIVLPQSAWQGERTGASEREGQVDKELVVTL